MLRPSQNTLSLDSLPHSPVLNGDRNCANSQAVTSIGGLAVNLKSFPGPQPHRGGEGEGTDTDRIGAPVARMGEEFSGVPKAGNSTGAQAKLHPPIHISRSRWVDGCRACRYRPAFCRRVSAPVQPKLSRRSLPDVPLTSCTSPQTAHYHITEASLSTVSSLYCFSSVTRSFSSQSAQYFSPCQTALKKNTNVSIFSR